MVINLHFFVLTSMERVLIVGAMTIILSRSSIMDRSYSESCDFDGSRVRKGVPLNITLETPFNLFLEATWMSKKDQKGARYVGNLVLESRQGAPT